MMKNKHYIIEQFDFNEVLDSTNDNDNIINNISNTFALDNIINVIKNTFETTHDYKYSKFAVSDDKRVIAVTTSLIYSEYQQLQIRFIINENNTIYIDYSDCHSIKDSIGITTLINQILEKVQKLLVIPVKCKIRILIPKYSTQHTVISSINELNTLILSYGMICFITHMAKNGYTDITILLNNNNDLTIDVDIQPYNLGNIAINKGTMSIENIDNDIITDFIKYTQTYILPDNGYVLFMFLPIYHDTALFITYFNKLALCKFNDVDTLTTMQHNEINISKSDIKLICDNILFKNTEHLDSKIKKLTYKLAYNKLDKFYIRIVLSCILSGNIRSIMENYNFYIQEGAKASLDPTMLKVYYNYVIDDIRNHGPIYNQILSYNV